MSISAQAFYPRCSLEVVICVRFFGLLVLLSQLLEAS